MNKVANMGGARAVLAEAHPERFGYVAGGLAQATDSASRALEADPEHVQLAWELVRLAGSGGDAPLPRSALEALMRATIGLLEATAQGSTRLPLGASSDGADSLIGRIGAEHIERLRMLADDGGAPTILATAQSLDEPRPLVVDSDSLYSYRMWVQETRLARLLAARLRGAAGGSDDAPPGVTAGARRRLDWDDAAIEAAIAAVLDDSGPELSAEQRRALTTAARRRLCVISGGPGTGKTFIVLAMIRVFLRLGVEPRGIALAAPTGKAARRLSDAAQQLLRDLEGLDAETQARIAKVPIPRTIHRTLGYTPYGGGRTALFKHGPTRPLPHDVVIVDEASMIDLELMHRLVRAVGAGARLVFLGDADQLPSVEAGAVLRDLVPDPSRAAGHPMSDNAVRLTHSYRMKPSNPAGRNILGVARCIVKGDVSWLDADESDHRRARPRTTPQAVAFEGVELLDGSNPVLAAMLERWFRQRTSALKDGGHDAWVQSVGAAYRLVEGGLDHVDRSRVAALIAHTDRHQILCMHRRGPRGTAAVNARLHETVARQLGEDPEQAFVPGDPVIVTRNDYQRKLFNGDTGIVLRIVIEDEGTARTFPMAAFPRARPGQRIPTFSVFHLDSLRGQLELAHAITVHKSQGTEYKDVMLIAPRQDSRLCTRETLYTGLTRSRRGAVVLGDREILATATTRKVERHSGVAERLAALCSAT